MRLLIRHLGELDPVEIVVIRGMIPLVSVLLRSEPGDRIAHIRLTDFYADTATRLEATIQEARQSGAEALIIDVRNNPGGLLSSVIDVASQFLGDGIVLYELDGDGNRTNWKVRGGGVADRPATRGSLTNRFQRQRQRDPVRSYSGPWPRDDRWHDDVREGQRQHSEETQQRRGDLDNHLQVLLPCRAPDRRRRLAARHRGGTTRIPNRPIRCSSKRAIEVLEKELGAGVRARIELLLVTDVKTIAVNRRARFDYEVLDTVEAGLVLTGSEIKAIRAGRVSLREAYGRPSEGELWLVGAPYRRLHGGSCVWRGPHPAA